MQWKRKLTICVFSHWSLCGNHLARVSSGKCDPVIVDWLEAAQTNITDLLVSPQYLFVQRKSLEEGEHKGRKVKQPVGVLCFCHTKTGSFIFRLQRTNRKQAYYSFWGKLRVSVCFLAHCCTNQQLSPCFSTVSHCCAQVLGGAWQRRHGEVQTPFWTFCLTNSFEISSQTPQMNFKIICCWWKTRVNSYCFVVFA